jgi:hypothetical protein
MPSVILEPQLSPAARQVEVEALLFVALEEKDLLVRGPVGLRVEAEEIIRMVEVERVEAEEAAVLGEVGLLDLEGLAEVHKPIKLVQVEVDMGRQELEAWVRLQEAMVALIPQEMEVVGGLGTAVEAEAEHMDLLTSPSFILDQEGVREEDIPILHQGLGARVEALFIFPLISCPFLEESLLMVQMAETGLEV